MQEKENIDDRVERALNSLDGTRRAQPAPWLYNRVLARMRKEEKSAWTQVGDFLARPAIAFGGLFVVLAINIIFLAGAHKDPVVPIVAQSDTVIESESIIASNSSFEYENLVQP